MMRKSIQRIVAFIMAILMVLTMSNWSGLTTVAKAADTKVRVYFQKPTEWTTAKVHVWNHGSSEYNADMKQLNSSSNTDWYYYDVTASQDFKILFWSGEWGGSNQTVDIDVSINNSTYVYAPVRNEEGNYNVNSKNVTRVYYKKPSDWSMANAHFWRDDNGVISGPETAWPGFEMTSEGDGSDWYYIDIPSTGKFSVIFSDNGDESTKAEQDNLDGTRASYTFSGAGFVGSNSANVLYCYVPVTGSTLNLQYRTAAEGGDNIPTTGTAIEGCPGWYRVEIANSIGFVQFMGIDGKGYIRDFQNVGITGNSGSLKVLVGTDNLTQQYSSGSEAVTALDLKAGYPGNPYPDAINVWYYNPDWTGVSDVKLIYKSDLTGEKTISTDQVTSFGSSMPGWFYVNGATAGVYAYRSTDNNISQIGFNGSDGVEGKKYSSDDENVRNATTDLYLTEKGSYASLEALLAVESLSVHPGTPASIIAYSSQNLADAAVTAEDGTAGTQSISSIGADYYEFSIPKNPVIAQYTASLTKTGVNVSLPLTKLVTYVNLDTGAAYDSLEELQASLNPSRLTFVGGGQATNVVITAPRMNYETGSTQAVEVLKEATVSGDNGVLSVPADGAAGYNVTYTYDGKTYTQRISAKDATIDLTNPVTTLKVYYYNGTSHNGSTESYKTDQVDEKWVKRWESVRAYVYYYPKGTAKETLLKNEDGKKLDWAECTDEGNGWWSFDTGVSATDPAFENGIFVQFKDGKNGKNATKSFQFENDYRVYATNMMTIHKSPQAAILALQERGTGGSLPEDSDTVTVWFYQSGGWSGVTVQGSNDGTNWATFSNTMTKDTALENNNGGYWYHAGINIGTKYIRFTDGINTTSAYDISANISNEIYCVQDTNVLESGWSTSPAEIVKAYGLVNGPSTNEISLPLTLLDYRQDDLFFEYDANKLRSMTFVLGNKGQTGNIGVGNVYVDNAYIIDEAGNRPGNVPYLDRNRNEYVTGILEPELVNGNPVYTKQAIIYVAKVIEAYCNQANIQNGESAVFQAVQPAIRNYKVQNGLISNWEQAYQETVEKFRNIDLATWDVTTQTVLSPMDYAYYVMNNFYNPNSKLNMEDHTYEYLVLKKTSPNVYGFYGNYSTDKTADELEQVHQVNYNTEAKKIYNVETEGEDRGGFFPLDVMEHDVGTGFGAKITSSKTGTHNYHYAMKASGKFVFNDAKDLYFTFTGDDDVVLYIDGHIALDLSGAHRSASYTIYLSDLKDQLGLVDGAYYDFDFFYMERHREYANLRVETNIEVVDVAGKVQKYAYDTDASGNKTTRIPTGAFREENDLVVYEFELTASSKDGLTNLKFSDPSLKVEISNDKIDLGSYVDEKGLTQNRSLNDIYVSVGKTIYEAGQITREKELKDILLKGLAAGERITIGGFKHVLTEGISGTVTATGTGLKATEETITTTDSHTININKPSISLSKSAVDSTGNNLPDGSVLQAGETAIYTLTAKNSGNAALTNVNLTDEKLGFSMGLDENGNGKLTVNEYTDPADLVFTVTGTGVTDGIYQITPSTSSDPQQAAAENKAAVETLITNLSKIAYPTNAAISVSGIAYPIVSTFPSTVVGTAQYLENVLSVIIGAAEKYINAYKEDPTVDINNYIKLDEETIPDGTIRTAVTNYINNYKAYVDNGATPLTGIVPTTDAAGFTHPNSVRGEATLTLNAKQTAYNYYSEKGQTIDLNLGGELEKTDITGNASGTEGWGSDNTSRTTLGDVTLTDGAHTIDLYLKDKTNGYGINIYQIILTDQNDPEKVITLTAENASPRYLRKDGTEIINYQPGEVSGTSADNAMVLEKKDESVLCSVNDLTEGKYTVEIVYVAEKDSPVSVVMVTDREPGDSVLTNTAGETLTTVTENGETWYVVDAEKGAKAKVVPGAVFSTVQYVNGDTGIETFGIKNASTDGKPNTITVSTFAVNNDVYVLDYGLDVSLTDTRYDNDLFRNDVLNADENKNEEVAFIGIRQTDEKIASRYQYTSEDYQNTETGVTGRFGKLSSNGNGTAANVNYSLNAFLEGIDRYAYAMQVGKKEVLATQKNVENSTPVMEANITIMPASIVYYEDNFTSVMTNGTKSAEDGSDTATNRQQGNGLTTQYGYDNAYVNDSTYSGNGYTALAGNQSIAFTFQGTGFDILTRTSNANLYVAVYDASMYERGAYEYNSTVNGENVTRTMAYAKKKAGGTGITGPIKTAYINAYNENQTIYQIPLISMDLRENYGTGEGKTKEFLVIATKTTGSEDLCVDGVRIYRPMGVGFDTLNSDDKVEAESAYSKAEGELTATVQDVRSLILGTGYTYDMQNPSDPVKEGTADTIKASLALFENNQLYVTRGTAVVECYTGTVDSGSIAETERVEQADQTTSLLAYAISGANNELYLTGEQYVVATVLNVESENATLQLGMKAVQGNSKVQYLNKDGGWNEVEGAGNVTTATEMYYKVDLNTVWTVNGKKVLIVRAAAAVEGEPYILSMTNIKYSGLTLKNPDATDLGENVVIKDESTSGTFEVLAKNTGKNKSVVTISVPNEVKEFTIWRTDATGLFVTYNTATGKKTYGESSTLKGDEVVISTKPGKDVTIYVVQLKKPANEVKGTYKITTTTSGTFSDTTFDLQ